jgi:hypothetical protein
MIDLAGRIVKDFGQWKVTEFGLENLEKHFSSYAIKKDRLLENNWVAHMRDKNWVDLISFINALWYARVYFNMPIRQEDLYHYN